MKLKDIRLDKVGDYTKVVADYPHEISFIADDVTVKEDEKAIHLNPTSHGKASNSPLRVKALKEYIEKYPDFTIENDNGPFVDIGCWEGGDGGDYCLSGDYFILYHEGFEVPDYCEISK